MIASFVGMFIFIGGEDHYNYGQIVNKLEDYIIVKINSLDFPAMKLFHMDCLAHSDDVFLFNNQQQLDEWLAWLETPTDDKKFKVLNFKKEK